MVLAGKALAVHHLHHLLGPRMERIEDPHLKRRTPGNVTLSRPAPARRHIGLGLGLAACQKGLSVGFHTAAALVHELLEARDEKRLLRLTGAITSTSSLVQPTTGAARTSPKAALSFDPDKVGT